MKTTTVISDGQRRSASRTATAALPPAATTSTMVGIELQDHHPHDHLDAGAAALQHARQPAGLALEMKAQRQLVHVDEGDVGELAHRMHRDAGENAVAPLRQYRHQHAHRAIADASSASGDAISHSVQFDASTGAEPTPLSASIAHLKVNGTDQRRDLRDQQQHHRPHHAHLQVRAVARPDIGPQVHQRPDQGRLFG